MSTTRLQDALVYLSLLLHGPVDMTLTSLTWGMEANPLVRHMGLTPWLGFKTGLLVALAAVYYWWIRPREPLRTTTLVLVAFSALGAAVMLSNLAALYGLA